MRVKPTKQRGNVLVEVGPKDSELLSTEAGRRPRFHLRKVLVPTDFSDGARAALDYAAALAQQFEAEILCLHVIEIPYGAGEAGIVVETEAVRRKLREQAKRQISKLLKAEALDQVRTQTLIRSGNPYNEIVQAAQDEGTDLIVIATHGRTGLARFFMGSTAERVVRHAHCPVLVVRQDEREATADVPPSGDQLSTD